MYCLIVFAEAWRDKLDFGVEVSIPEDRGGGTFDVRLCCLPHG
jgi:hypothetical protein